MVRQTAALILCVFALVGAARAQTTPSPASLVADSVVVDPSGTLIAEGNVDVFYQGTRLSAKAVRYDPETDRLSVEGPITVIAEDGTILEADAATLAPDLQNGLLVSARLVLDRQLQLAAAEIQREGERFTRLERVIASSCEICAQNHTPLWEIRARSVVHDAEERQIFFTNAQFRLAGIPIAYFPRLRLPDPTLDRARGFLLPEIRQSSELGIGVAVPYFVPIGRHADITLTPYISDITRTLEFRYRQELTFGSLNFEGAFSDDDLEGGRGYLFGEAIAELPKDYTATLSLELVSDPGYLFTYGFSDRDRLQNELRLDRIRDDELFLARIVEFRTLRDTELPISDTLPDTLGEILYTREIPTGFLGGQSFGSFRAATLNRDSSDDILGRDVRRIGAEIDWRRDWVLANGMVFAAEAGVAFDAFDVDEDSTFDSSVNRVAPRTAAELRWPMVRTTANGGSEILEPVIRLDMADLRGGDTPLEDSLIVEFDEGNLFSPTRFPGVDGIEDDTRLAFGASWRRVDPNGWTLDMALGRILALDGDLGFAEGTGLTGDQSEWLASARFQSAGNLALATRSLFDNNVTFTLSETRLDWKAERYELSSTYLFAEPEPSEGREESLSELTLDGHYDLTPNWRAEGELRYDLNADRAASTGLGLEFANECILVNVSLSRRFASSTNLTPTTDIGVQVSLNGVGSAGRNAPRRASCSG